MALAPAGFGEFGDRLLVGNFGDGTINAFDVATGGLIGHLADESDEPIVIDGLWALGFGNGYLNQPINTLFFTAGPNNEQGGLYGRIDIQGTVTPPNGGTVTPPNGGTVTPPNGGTVTPPNGGTVTPPNGGTVTPPNGGTVTPPDGGTVTPPDGGTVTPPNGGTVTPPEGGTVTPPEGGTVTPPQGGM
jgi:hypothetical protein